MEAGGAFRPSRCASSPPCRTTARRYT